MSKNKLAERRLIHLAYAYFEPLTLALNLTINPYSNQNSSLKLVTLCKARHIILKLYYVYINSLMLRLDM